VSFASEVSEKINTFLSRSDDVFPAIAVEVGYPEIYASAAGGFWIAVVKGMANEFAVFDFEIIESDGIVSAGIMA